LLLDFGYAHLFSDTVPLDQDAAMQLLLRC
jgi:hypothetical protein